MILSADDAAATLRLVVPGFVALQVFYWFGLATKRTDWRWLIWSLIASVPITYIAAGLAERAGATSDDLAGAIARCGRARLADEPPADFQAALRECADTAIAAHNDALQFAWALGLAVVAGLIAAFVWRALVAWRPTILYGQEVNAWVRVLRSGRWMRVKVKDDKVYYGWNMSMADPVETDDLDLYLAEPEVVTEGGKPTKLDAEGLLLRREDILLVEVLPASGSRGDSRRLSWRERITGRLNPIAASDA